MGIYTRTTRRWLDRRYQSRTPDGLYLAHQPIYGLGHPAAEPNQLPRLARVFQILKTLARLRIGSFLDVGGSEGYVAWLLARLWSVPGVSCDLSVAACRMARALFGVPGAAIDCARLPFRDQSFDVVLCSEVIEHVEHPVETVLELLRVARVAVVLTTEELHHDREAIERYLFRRPGYPHMERNVFHADDLQLLFGSDAQLSGQCREPQPQEPVPLPLARTWLLGATRDLRPGPGVRGVVLLKTLDPAAHQTPRHDDAALLDALLQTVTPAVPPPPLLVTAEPDDFLWSRLCCPLTHTPLRSAGSRLVSAGGHSYPVVDGIPDLFPVDAPDPSRAALETRLGTLLPRDLERRRQILQLRDQLELPERAPLSAWEFRNSEHRRGWWPNEQLVERRGDPRAFRWHSTGDDPWLLSPCLARRVQGVELTLRVHNPAFAVDAAVGQVFWMGADDDGFGEDRKVDFALRNDGEIHTVRVPLTGHPRLPAAVYWLRLDLVNGPCELDLYRVAVW